MNATTHDRLNDILKQTARFLDRDNAFAYASRPGLPGKRLWVMLGDDGRYWVTTPANCERLNRMGYEYAQ